ncbi:MAG TPA: GNAT family N-acetyltransferase, partial [Acidimicrobiia bacterium]|nr:GNAT family N-acetyltransferase [Acidimicrobiia bacterium]
DTVPGMLADAGRDAAAASDAPWRRIGRTVAAVPPEVAARVADLLESAASAMRDGDRDDPGDPLVSLSFVLAPLAPSIRTRAALPDDLTHLRRVLYEAVAWNPQRPVPPLEVTLAHPELARYHEGWGRFGDLAVIAEADGAVIGGALCRLFDATDHGHGFVDDHTPELAVAVWRGQRGAGVGTRLLAALEVEAVTAGFEQMSLSVDTDNPARQLYMRSGYRQVSQDESGVRMVKRLVPPA